MAVVAAGWLCFLSLQLAFVAVAHDHSRATDTYHVSAGHLFLLTCNTAQAHSEVHWSSGDNSSLPAGAEVKDGALWFLPVEVSHTGTYTCEKRTEAGLFRMTFELSVSTGKCPVPPETISITKGVSDTLPCKQTEILRLNSPRNIRWMKDCLPVQQGRDDVSVDKNGDMRLTALSKEEDDGIYTCLIDISVDGRKYTAARSIQLEITDNIEKTLLVEPQVVKPQEEVAIVKVGTSANLTCLAYIGYSEDNETLMYWTVDGDYTEDYEELSESRKYIHTRGKVYIMSTLSISKVRTEFLNVDIYCYIMTPFGESCGLAWLQEADHTDFYISVSICLASSLAILCLAASYFLFRVDLTLAYRKLLRHFPKQQVPDGKLYDAYVSFLHPDSSDDIESFAMQILPEELEERHGYSLYIRGRDDSPGESIHDVIAATVHQCRRLIIILSSEGQTQETLPLCYNKNQLCYEQKIGLYDVLTRNDLKVILVEMDGPVDYSRLPESLRYIKKKKGALTWKKVHTGSHKLTKSRSNKSFWKNMRYHMPAVPARRRQAVV